ncbi:MAG: glycosyltransferase family 4 protein, partial [Candidatus Margulisbacteria bacterium]|nr:glycosyltransferase family 4 protein [Candidatus Margulisiibacteriota bacterium]
EKIKELISQSLLGDYVQLIKKTPHIYDWYIMSDIFLLPSTYESFPRTILEAMAFGLPIIATDVFGIKEQLEEGLSGILIRPNDPLAISKAIRYLVDNKDKATDIGKKAFERVSHCFSLDKNIDEHDKLFRSLIKNQIL